MHWNFAGFGSDEIPGAVNDPDPSELDHSTDEEDSRFLDRSFQRLHELTTMYKDDEGRTVYDVLDKHGKSAYKSYYKKVAEHWLREYYDIMMREDEEDNEQKDS